MLPPAVTDWLILKKVEVETSPVAVTVLTEEPWRVTVPPESTELRTENCPEETPSLAMTGPVTFWVASVPVKEPEGADAGDREVVGHVGDIGVAADVAGYCRWIRLGRLTPVPAEDGEILGMLQKQARARRRS